MDRDEQRRQISTSFIHRDQDRTARRTAARLWFRPNLLSFAFPLLKHSHDDLVQSRVQTDGADDEPTSDGMNRVVPIPT
jgi:hypothetical protein